MKKIKILFDTFIRKGLKYNHDEDLFYNCIISGFQGSGKTYYGVLKIVKEDKRFFHIITNLQSLNIPGKKIEYKKTIGEIINSKYEGFTIFFIDEIHKYFSKQSYRDDDFYTFLQQMRKKKCLCIMTTQEWKSIPTWLRYPCKYIYNTSKIPFSTIFKTQCLDGLSIVWDSQSNSWTGDELMTIYYKRNKKIASYYDTNEII